MIRSQTHLILRAAAMALTVAVVVSACSKTYEEPPPVDGTPAPDRFQLFLLAGQSNMAGRGEVAPQDREPHPRVLSLGREGEWVPAVDPIHFDKPIAGVGLGRSFGIALAEKDASVTIGLVPAAVGGSAVAAWQPGGFHAQTGDYPYDEAIARARRAMQDGDLKAILWHQGESDAPPDRAAVYKENLKAVIARFREDLGQPELPFIIGQLGRFPGKPWTESEEVLDRAHREIAEEDPRVAFVSSEGLLPMEDQVHIDADSQREFGKRYADAWLELSAARERD